jgi:hypothetical protein
LKGLNEKSGAGFSLAGSQLKAFSVGERFRAGGSSDPRLAPTVPFDQHHCRPFLGSISAN